MIYPVAIARELLLRLINRERPTRGELVQGSFALASYAGRTKAAPAELGFVLHDLEEMILVPAYPLPELRLQRMGRVLALLRSTTD